MSIDVSKKESYNILLKYIQQEGLDSYLKIYACMTILIVFRANSSLNEHREVLRHTCNIFIDFKYFQSLTILP